MHARKDLDKILNYAKSHGIKVIFRLRRPKAMDCAWILFESRTIIVTYKTSDSFRELCASLLHELAHLITYALDKNAFKEYFRCDSLEKPGYHERRVIYLREKADIALMPKLQKLLRLESVTPAFIKFHRDYDTWQYYFYMKKGRFPTRKEQLVKKEYFKKKWIKKWNDYKLNKI